MSEKLDKLKKVLELVSEDKPSNKEVASVIRGVLDTIKTLRVDLTNELKKVKEGGDSQVEKIATGLGKEIDLVRKLVGLVDANSTKSLSSLEDRLEKEILRVEELIPDIDFSDVERKIKEVDKKIPKPLRPEEIRNLLETLKGKSRLRKDAIDGLEEELKEIRGDIKSRSGGFAQGGLIGRDMFKDIDISDQLDGVTKTFNIQAVWYVQNVNLSSFPYGALRKGVDYTWTPTSITFTSEIDASTQLATGQTCLLSVVL